MSTDKRRILTNYLKERVKLMLERLLLITVFDWFDLLPSCWVGWDGSLMGRESRYKHI